MRRDDASGHPRVAAGRERAERAQRRDAQPAGSRSCGGADQRVGSCFEKATAEPRRVHRNSVWSARSACSAIAFFASSCPANSAALQRESSVPVRSIGSSGWRELRQDWAAVARAGPGASGPAERDRRARRRSRLPLPRHPSSSPPTRAICLVTGRARVRRRRNAPSTRAPAVERVIARRVISRQFTSLMWHGDAAAALGTDSDAYARPRPRGAARAQPIAHTREAAALGFDLHHERGIVRRAVHAVTARHVA
mgnify:CR=1 FL=1